MDDLPQHDRQREVAGDHPVGLQQAPQPALRGHYVLCAADQLRQQLIHLQPRTGLRPRPHRIALCGRLVQAGVGVGVGIGIG